MCLTKTNWLDCMLLVVAVVKLATNAARTRCARCVSHAHAVSIPPRPYPFTQVPHSLLSFPDHAGLSCSHPSSTIGCHGHRDPLGGEIPLPVIIFENQRLKSTFREFPRSFPSHAAAGMLLLAARRAHAPLCRRHAVARRETCARASVPRRR